MSTKIEWTDETWNPVIGCSRVSAGCQNCYAERVAHRGLAEQHRGLTIAGAKGPRWNGQVRFVPSVLDKPLRWRKPRRVFVNSLSDLFHEGLSNEEIAAVFGVMAASPQHTFQVLTKRPQRMRDWFRWFVDDDGKLTPESKGPWFHAVVGAPDGPHEGWARPFPWPHIWLGVSVEDQATADERIPLLLDTPAAVRWVSYEPALGPVDFDDERDWLNPLRYSLDELVHPPLDWVVVGGESGPGARPFNVDWARTVIEQGRLARVPVFVKQLGALPFAVDGGTQFAYEFRNRKGGDWDEWPEALRVRKMPGPS